MRRTKSLLIILAAFLFLCCNRLLTSNKIKGTVTTGCDGITVIKAFQARLSDRVKIGIIMRPELKKTVYVIWSATDSHNRIKQYKSAIIKGMPGKIEIAVKPGASIRKIQVTGYERIGA